MKTFAVECKRHGKFFNCPPVGYILYIYKLIGVLHFGCRIQTVCQPLVLCSSVSDRSFFWEVGEKLVCMQSCMTINTY